MESGVMTPYASLSGWMGRGLDVQGYDSVAMSLPTPLILRGAVRPDGYFPSWLRPASQKVYDRLLPLWASDKVLSSFGKQISAERAMGGRSPFVKVGKKAALPALATEAGVRLRRGEGPRMAVIDHVGFDSHANEPRDSGRVMKDVDEAIGAFRVAIGDDVWKKTLIVTVTEFGRTVAENGSRGTDHGWGTSVFVLGGRLKKGGIVGDWPGLAKKSMFEGRDLASTLDARALYGAIMSNVLEIDPERVRREVIEHQPTRIFEPYL
ncbi:MAG: DUF1501 domain-containing protein, partial [Alphaproteobacteria bacterium]